MFVELRNTRRLTSLRQSTQNFHGVVQRLVQKEKQVLQLQAELDRLKAQNPAETREIVRVDLSLLSCKPTFITSLG